jgi:hypothetical protein
MFLPQSYVGIKPPFGTPINFSHPHAQKQVLNLLFNEGCGNKVFDSSLNGNIGILNGAIWVLGPNGWELNFDGNDYIDAGTDDILNLTGSFTFSTRIKTSIDGGRILARWNFGASKRQFQLIVGGGISNKINIFISNNGTSTAAFRPSLTTVTDGVSRDVDGVYDAVNQTLDVYIEGLPDNGTLSGTVPTSLFNGSGEETVIGAQKSSGGYSSFFNGEIGKMFIWPRVQTDAEILYRHLNPYAMFDVPINPAFFGLPPVAGLSIPVAMRYYRNLRNG